MPLAYLNRQMSVTNSKCASFGESKRRCVTFNIIPSNRADVDCFSITNSQNDDVMKVKPAERSFTLCLEPGMVTFTVNTVYTCPVISDLSVSQFSMRIDGECSLNEICTYSVGSSGFHESVLYILL